MTLRHIKPRSVDWEDAVWGKEEEQQGTRMDPEEVLKLRRLLAVEHVTMGMPSAALAPTFSLGGAPSGSPGGLTARTVARDRAARLGEFVHAATLGLKSGSARAEKMGRAPNAA